MADHPSLEHQQLVYITTSLDTRLALPVHLSDTVSDLKKKLILEHLSCFPSFGEIKIHAVKIKRNGFFYLLTDLLLLPAAFKGRNYWYLYVEASTSAVYLEEIIHQNDPFNCEAHVLQRGVWKVEKDNKGGESAIGDVLMDASSEDGASGFRKKLKLQESSKCHKQEEPALCQSAEGSKGHSQEPAADLTEFLTKEPVKDNEGIIIEEKIEKVLSVQEQVLIEAEIGAQCGLQSGVDLTLVCNNRLLDEYEANGRAEEDVSFATNLDQSRSSSKKRKKPSQKKEFVMKKSVDNGEHGLEQVDGSQDPIPEAKPKEPAIMETRVQQTTDDMAQIEKQVVPVDVGDRSIAQKGISLLLGNSDRDAADGRVEKGEIVPDSLAAVILKNGSSRDKRQKSANKKDSSRKKTVVPTKEHVLAYVEGSPGTISLVKPREPDNKESVVEEMTVSMALVPEQGTVAGTGHRGGIQHGPELVLEGINSQVNEKGVIVLTVSDDVMGENVSTKKRRKTPQRREQSKKKNVIANDENLQKHVDDLGVISSMGPGTHNKETGFAKSENVIQASEQALNTDTSDVSGVQNDPGQVEKNGEFIDDEAIRGAGGVVSQDPFIAGVMEDKSFTKNRKKSNRTKESSKKKSLNPDEKHGPKHVEGPEGVVYLPKAKETYNSGKSLEEKMDDTMIVHDQALEADAHYGSDVLNGPALLLLGENDTQFLGDKVISGTEKGHVANDLLAYGVVVDELSEKKTKKSANKPSKKKTVYPEEKLGLKQDPKEKLVLMHAEASVGGNSAAETKEADNKEKDIEDKSADVVVVHEKPFDDNAGYGVQEENNELFYGDGATDEVKRVNLPPDILASGVMEDESSKKKRKKSTNKQRKKNTVHLEEKLASKQDLKDKVLPQHVEDSAVANSLTKAKEADDPEKYIKENSADVVVVHERTFDTDAGDKLQEEIHEQFHGDEATGEVEKVNLAPDLEVSDMVKDTSSPRKKKPTQKKNATSKKPNDSREDYNPENIESSPVGSSLARPRELVRLNNNLSQAEGNDSISVSFEKTADGLTAEVNSQETLNRKGMTGSVQVAQRKVKRKQSATDKSIEQEGNINASSEMTKKESRKFISASDVSKSDNLLSSAASFHASAGKLEESGSIKFSDYFSPGGPQVFVASSGDIDAVVGLKGNDKISPPNRRKNRDSEASASAIQVSKNDKKRRSNLDRYCVAFRNSSNQSLQASVEGQKRNLLDKSGSIFEDDSSSGPNDAQESVKSDATTRTPSNDSVSSDYSDGDSDALMKSRENGNYSLQNGRRSNMKNLLSSGGKDVELTKILQRSSTYRMVRKAASQSREKDMDSQPVDFVPDSQADV